MNIAIVEDSTTDRNVLLKFLDKFSSEEGITFHIKCFDNGMQFLEGYSTGFDIVLMDIEMPLMDGMETARKLRRIDSNVPLIFITNMAQYAINGYEVDAMGFLIKPVLYLNFSFRLKKAINLVKENQASIMVKSEDGVRKINISELLYVEVVTNYLYWHTINETIKSRSTLILAEQQLENYSKFVRCNNCYLVNLEHVNAISGNEATVGSEKLSISRNRKKEFLNALTAYLGGKK